MSNNNNTLTAQLPQTALRDSRPNACYDSSMASAICCASALKFWPQRSNCSRLGTALLAAKLLDCRTVALRDIGACNAANQPVLYNSAQAAISAGKTSPAGNEGKSHTVWGGCSGALLTRQPASNSQPYASNKTFCSNGANARSTARLGSCCAASTPCQPA